MEDLESQDLLVMTSDKVVFVLPKDVVPKSNVLSSMICLANDGGPPPSVEVTASTLNLVVQWCQNAEASSRNHEDIELEFTEWEKSFLHITGTDPMICPAVLCKLCSAANYLDIEGLISLTCKALALKMKSRSTEEMREHFGIAYDFAEGEQAMLNKESSLCTTS